MDEHQFEEARGGAIGALMAMLEEAHKVAEVADGLEIHVEQRVVLDMPRGAASEWKTVSHTMIFEEDADEDLDPAVE